MSEQQRMDPILAAQQLKQNFSVVYEKQATDTVIDALQARVKELEAQRDELLLLAKRARVFLNMEDMEYAFTDTEKETLRQDLIKGIDKIEAENAK